MPLIAKSRNDASSMEAFLTFINPNSSALSRPNCIVKGRPTPRSLTIRWLGLLIPASGTIFDHWFSIDFVYVLTHDLHRICVYLLFHFGLRRSLGSKLVWLLHCHSLLPRLRRVSMDIHTYCAYIYWMCGQGAHARMNRFERWPDVTWKWIRSFRWKKFIFIGLKISIDFIWLLYDIFDLSVCVYMYIYVLLLLRSFYMKIAEGT